MTYVVKVWLNREWLTYTVPLSRDEATDFLRTRPYLQPARVVAA